VPTVGLCPPVGVGIVSQYWLSALSAGLLQPVSWFADAHAATAASVAAATTRMIVARLATAR
jgi:hypothetical protein